MSQGTVLVEDGDEANQVYFPHYGIVVHRVLRDGKAIETATVGREGPWSARWPRPWSLQSLVRVVVR